MVGSKDSGVIYLIDFGTASRYLNDKGEHIEKEYIGRFQGNIEFASPGKIRCMS